MELKQISYSSFILIAILSVTIALPHSPPESLDCCNRIVGHSCFCNVEKESADYWGYYEEPDHDYLYDGDCECNEISQLSVVLLTEGKAESISFFDTNNEKNVDCLFTNIQCGDEIKCNAKGRDKVFADSTSFEIKRSDGSICKGRIDTTCAGDVIINEIDDQCDELVVTGYVGDQGGICDDGLAPCHCIGRYQHIDSDTDDSNDSHDSDQNGKDSDKNNDDSQDSDKVDDNQDNDSKEGDGMIVSPLFAEFLDDREDTESSGDVSQSDSSLSDSNDEQQNDNEDDGTLRIVEPVIAINDQASNDSPDTNDDGDDDDDDDDDDFIDDDLLFIDSDDSNDGLFIENESNEDDERSNGKRNNAMTSPMVNIIEQEDITKASIYVTMSYYVILLIVLINTLTFSFYFCIRPLNKYCNDREFNMDYNGYSKKSSKDIIIQSSIDSVDSIDADNDTDDMSPLSDATEDEQE